MAVIKLGYNRIVFRVMLM